MYEFVPLIGGVVLGLVIAQITGRMRKGIVVVVLSLIIGYAACALSGELALSWIYLVFDVGQVLFAALATQLLLSRWQRRSAI